MARTIKLITPFKKNMKNKLVEWWEKLMLRKRSFNFGFWILDFGLGICQF
jgi:hypothetical protein